jgi:glycosyltransferase involved in cell wall biosynthesis
MAPKVDIAVLSLGTTPGLRRTDEAFTAQVRESGASCELVPVTIGPLARLRRRDTITDLIEASAARRAARGIDARAIVFSTVTATYFQRPSVPYAVRFDAPATLNRPGWAGAWQRACERRALNGARLLLPLSRAAADALPPALTAGARSDGGPPPRVVTLPVPVEELDPAPVRDIDAIAHARWPERRGLDLLCAAWADARSGDERLVIGGLTRTQGLRWLARASVAEPHGVDWVGELPRSRWLELVARSRLFVAASRYEGHGIAQLEALAAGTTLVTAPSAGPCEALPLARELAPELVAAGVSRSALAEALRAGLSRDERARERYAERARALLAPYREESVRRIVATEVLPALGIDRA